MARQPPQDQQRLLADLRRAADPARDPGSSKGWKALDDASGTSSSDRGAGRPPPAAKAPTSRVPLAHACTRTRTCSSSGSTMWMLPAWLRSLSSLASVHAEAAASYRVAGRSPVRAKCSAAFLDCTRTAKSIPRFRASSTSGNRISRLASSLSKAHSLLRAADTERRGQLADLQALQSAHGSSASDLQSRLARVSARLEEVLTSSVQNAEGWEERFEGFAERLVRSEGASFGAEEGRQLREELGGLESRVEVRSRELLEELLVEALEAAEEKQHRPLAQEVARLRED
ncbi:unnamed protein product, partial [Prorocentrum cordatum]